VAGIYAGTGAPAVREAAGGTHARRGRGSRSRTVAWLVAVVPAVLGLITGGYRIGVPPLWRDEAATKEIAGRSVRQIFATMPHDDVVHGAYYLIVHFTEKFVGTSNGALRLPSMIAMAAACAFTALVARRLAALTRSPYPDITGLVAGVIFALLPYMIRYAQEARSYAIVTMMAAIATYLLLRAVADGRWWWAAYGVAIGLTGLFNIFGLLILAAHGLSLLAAGFRARPQDSPNGRRILGIPLAWLISGVAAIVVLIPLIAMAYAQRDALSWMSSTTPFIPNLKTIVHLWAGDWALVWPVFGLAAFGVVAGLVADRLAGRPAQPFTPGTVALPWLAAPPLLLLAASQLHPVYDIRYVEYCLPALAILAAWGLTWLWRLFTATPLRRVRLAWLPAAAVLAALVVMLLPADTAIRQPSVRPDDLEREAQIVADNERPGDIVFFIPINDRIVSMPFPGPWEKLRDIALKESPVASDTLYGIDVSPAELLRRFTHVSRVWVVTSSEVNDLSLSNATPLDKEEVRLISGMRRISKWRDGDDLLLLYQVRPEAR
jgi:mannosyltransferase